MINLTNTEVAYLAGLFDGEGTVGYYLKSNGYHRVQVALYNSDPNIMKWIKDHISFGSITISKRTKYIHYSWIVSSKQQVREFLNIIKPFLIIKADQVNLLLSFLDAEEEVRGVGVGIKITNKDLLNRKELEVKLKALKTSNYQSIH